MRRILVVLIILLTTYFLVTQFAELEMVIETFRQADWRWLAIAVAIEALWLLNVAATLSTIYRLLGVRERTPRLVGLASAANFLNVVTPSLGLGGMAAFVIDGRRRGLSTGRVTTAAALYVLYDYIGFLVVLALGLIVLFRRNQLNAGEIGASLFLVLIASGLAVLLYLGSRSADLLARALERIGSVVNGVLRPFIKRDYLELDRAQAFAREIADGLRFARRSQRGLLIPALLALTNKALLVTIMFFVFQAFHIAASIDTLIAGVSIGYLFLLVSPTPSGVGFVEGAVALALNSLRIPLAASAVVSLAYRGITFWLPLAFGMLCFQWVVRENGKLLPKRHSDRGVISHPGDKVGNV